MTPPDALSAAASSKRTFTSTKPTFSIGVRRKPGGFDVLDRPHRGRHAMHVHAGGVGRYLRDQSGVLAVGLKLQFSPARHDLGAQSERAAETLGRIHGLLCGLPVDKKNPSKGKDKIGTLIQRHESFPQSMRLKA